MNTRFVETFVMLARLGSVRRVAAQLHTTPGAISMRVRALEKELGVCLFARDRRKLAITADGTRLLPRAEALVEATRALEGASDAEPTVGSRVRLGVIETVVHTCLPDIIKAAAAAHPDIELDLTIDLTPQLGELLMRRELDLIVRVAGDVGNPFVATETLMELPVHWIARRGLVPARAPIEKTLARQLLTMMRGSVPYLGAVALAQQLAAQRGMAASTLRISGSPSLAALVSMVREGVGVAIMPGVLVREQLERRELVELAMPAPEPFRLALCHPTTVAPAAARVAEVVRRVARAYVRRTGEHFVRGVG